MHNHARVSGEAIYIKTVFSRLQVSEHVIFSGDVLTYLSWKITESHVPDVERLYWLKKSLRGPALACMESLSLSIQNILMLTPCICIHSIPSIQR